MPLYRRHSDAVDGPEKCEGLWGRQGANHGAAASMQPPSLKAAIICRIGCNVYFNLILSMIWSKYELRCFALKYDGNVTELSETLTSAAHLGYSPSPGSITCLVFPQLRRDASASLLPIRSTPWFEDQRDDHRNHDL